MMAAKSIQLSSPETLSPFKALRLQPPPVQPHGFPRFTWLLVQSMTMGQTQNTVTKAKTITDVHPARFIHCRILMRVIAIRLTHDQQQRGQHPCLRTVIFRLCLIVHSRFAPPRQQAVSLVHYQRHLRHSLIPRLRHKHPLLRPTLPLLLVSPVPQVFRLKKRARVLLAQERKQLLWRIIKRGWNLITERNPRMQLQAPAVFRWIPLRGTARVIKHTSHSTKETMWTLNYTIRTFADLGHLRFLRVATTCYASMRYIMICDFEHSTKNTVYSKVARLLTDFCVSFAKRLQSFRVRVHNGKV